MSAAPAIDDAWIEQRLRPQHPRLIWRPGDEERIRSLLSRDATARAYHQHLLARAEGMLKAASVDHRLDGHRLLAVSRTALARTTTLAYGWRLTGDSRFLDCLDDTLTQVSRFPDWNPHHFLDTAEMAMAVALGLDWAHDDLPEATRLLAARALKEQAILPSMHPALLAKLPLTSNWNQVCNTGLVAAVLACDPLEKEIAPAILQRAVDLLPHVMATYAPDGVYPEGASYWSYGSGFHALLLSLLQTALGDDLGLAGFPGFLESADVVHQLTAPSGDFFDFGDCRRRIEFNPPLLWFALETGAGRHVQHAAIRQLPRRGSIDDEAHPEIHRLAAPAFLWYLHHEPRPAEPLPTAFHARGENPVVVFRSAMEDPNAIYLAAKGGRASRDHGHMDAGSFIFELQGVRWALDPGFQPYEELERVTAARGADLWNPSQDSERWSFLSMNNFGHNTLTLNDGLHRANGVAPLAAFDEDRRETTFNLTEVLAEPARRALRTFRILTDQSIQIVDRLTLARPATLRWQMLTQAEVEVVPGGALLRQNGRTLRLRIHEPMGLQVEVTSLHPPPRKEDLWIEGLKRLDIHLAHAPEQAEEVVLRIQLAAT